MFGFLPSARDVSRIFCEEKVVQVPTMWRVRRQHGRRWFEFGFCSPVQLIGNARRGFDDVPGTVELDLLWSLDPATPIADWKRGIFRPCHRAEVPCDGGFEYWSRSTVPIDRVPSQFARLAVHSFSSRKNWR